MSHRFAIETNEQFGAFYDAVMADRHSAEPLFSDEQHEAYFASFIDKIMGCSEDE